MKLVEMPIECKKCGGKFNDIFKVKSKGKSLCVSCYDKDYYHKVRADKIRKGIKPEKPKVVLNKEVKVIKSNDFVEFMHRIIKRNYNISLNEMSDIITYWTELSGLPVWTYDSENDLPMKGGKQIYKMWKDLEKIYKYEYETM